MIKKLLQLIVLYTLIFQTSYSYINIYPMKLDKRIDGEGINQIFYLYNSTKEDIRYRIYIEKSLNNNLDMSKWIEYYPKSVTIKPGEEKELKLFIKAPSEIKKGEYLAVLGIKQVEIPIKRKNFTQKNGMIQVFTDLKIEITGFVGDISPKIKTENIKVKLFKNGEVELSGNLINIGNRRGIFQFYLLNSRGKEKCLLGEKRILKGNEIDLSNLKFSISDSEMKKDIKKYDYLVITEKENKKIKKVISIK